MPFSLTRPLTLMDIVIVSCSILFFLGVGLAALFRPRVLIEPAFFNRSFFRSVDGNGPSGMSIFAQDA
jgi:hypothetical protein